MAQKFIKDGAGSFSDYCSAMGIQPQTDKLSRSDLALLIDHTLLKPEASTAEVKKLCAEAAEYGFKSVCINPFMIPSGREYLKGSKVLVCTVIGFPLGASSSAAKAFETADAVKAGADEIDMVINIGALKEKNYGAVKADISGVVNAAGGKLVKVIFETCLLNPEEIKTASEISAEAGANYIKTSTGFSTGGATVEAIIIMRDTVGSSLGVKASGGVRDRKGMFEMIAAGATRIGASAGVAIVSGQDAGEGKY